MFRWPLVLTPLSLGSGGTSRDATLEITPRGAVFTLASLAHVGHAAHLAVLDAYLKGQFRPTRTVGIGEDSRLVFSALAAPLVAAHELGIEQLGLGDLILLPAATSADCDGLGREPDSVRLLLRGPGGWCWVRAAEHFEPAGCLGTPRPGLGSAWYDAIAELPTRPSVREVGALTRGLTPAPAELRAPTARAPAPAELTGELRTLGLARFARSGERVRRAATRAARLLGASNSPSPPLAAEDLGSEARTWSPVPPMAAASDPGTLASALAEPIRARQPVEASFRFQGAEIDVSLRPDLDGYQTLCLLPPVDAPPAAVFELMRAAACAIVEALMGRPLAEYRTEPIALRLLGADGRTTTLEVGASIVVVRNQAVFAGWVGSDGRVMIKLFPPGGMTGSPGAA